MDAQAGKARDMQRLNIPFQRGYTTTRPQRRVVWLISLIVIPVLLLVAVWLLAEQWYARNTLTAATPDDTVISTHFILHKKTIPFLTTWLEGVPLISHRSLTLQHLLPYSEGELTWFFHEDGRRSVAIRSSQDRLPYDLFDAHGVIVREVKPQVFLLSDVPISHTKDVPKVKTGWFTQRPLLQHVGDITFLSQTPPVGGPIYSSEKTLRVLLPPLSLSRLPIDVLPEEVSTAITTPIWPTESHTFSFPIDTTLASLDTITTQQLSGWVLAQPGVIFLTEGETPQFFWATLDNDSFKSADIERLLRSSQALQSPSIRPWHLPDQSVAREIIVDPEQVTLEEVILAGTPVRKVAGYGRKEALFTTRKDGWTILTNSESLLTQWISDVPNTELLEGRGLNASISLTQLSPFIFPRSSWASSAMSQSLMTVMSRIFVTEITLSTP